eukprot:g42431.t1
MKDDIAGIHEGGQALVGAYSDNKSAFFLTVKTYEDMTLEELEENEDEFNEEDERAIEMYRQQRLAEWKATQMKMIFGEILEISGPDYVQEVTKAGKDVWVILHLYKQGIPLCALVNQHLSELARMFPETKFIKAISTTCIPNYPDRNLPTIFVYHDGDIKAQLLVLESIAIRFDSVPAQAFMLIRSNYLLLQAILGDRKK